MTRRTPTGPPPPPVVQRVRIRYAKRGRLRFTSHRDFARAFERALRRAGVPMAYSAGFTPHPKISYVGAAPTGTASEAEYLEIGLARSCDVGGAAAGHRRGAAGRDRRRRRGTGRSWVARRADGGHALADRAARGCRADRAGGGRRAAGPGTGRGRADDKVRPARRRRPIPAGVDRGDARIRRVWRAVRPPACDTGRGRTAGDPRCAPRRRSGRTRAPSPVSPPWHRPLAVRVAQGPLDEAGAVGDPLAADRTLRLTSPVLSARRRSRWPAMQT